MTAGIKIEELPPPHEWRSAGGWPAVFGLRLKTAGQRDTSRSDRDILTPLPAYE